MALAASPSEQAGPLVAARDYVQLNIATFPATCMHLLQFGAIPKSGPLCGLFS
jgi:hypothetical protein